MEDLQQIRDKYNTALVRIRTVHIKRFPDHPTPLFLISNAYPGVWLEHVYDAVCYAAIDPSRKDVAQSQVELFLSHQKEDGQLPCYVLDRTNPNAAAYKIMVGFGQLQECVSFARLCFEAWQLTGSRALLIQAYCGCSQWDNWLVRYRTTLKTDLIELFCEYDSGHDNSPRFTGIASRGCPGGDARQCNPEPFLPLLAPDLNAVVYGSRLALADMADQLGKPAEAAEWRRKARLTRDALFNYCYDPADNFFYDVDRQGQFRKYRAIHIANLFQEHVLEQPLADAIYYQHLKNPQEFWTPYPFPSLSVSDPARQPQAAGNSWGFYAQGLTALRTLRWMDHYGKGEDLECLMRAWVEAIARDGDLQFTQEIHPLTGEPSGSSEWYSSSMLFYIQALRRLGLLD